MSVSRLLLMCLVLFVFRPSLTYGETDCSSIIDPPVVFFVNGMYTDKGAAYDAKNDLRNSYFSFLASLPNQSSVTDEMRCVEFRVAHNQREEAWLDLLEAFVQSLSDDTITFWQWMARSHGIFVPEWFREKQLEISKTVSSALAYIVDDDLRKHVDVYAGTLGNRIVVAHSQGNYYATEANLLLPAYLRVPVFAVATPEGNEPDEGYLTYGNDTVINALRAITGALPANAEGNCSTDWSCHGMRESYLATDREHISRKIFNVLFPPVPY